MQIYMFHIHILQICPFSSALAKLLKSLSHILSNCAHTKASVRLNRLYVTESLGAKLGRIIPDRKKKKKFKLCSNH